MNECSKSQSQDGMTFLEHLEELRSCIIKSALALFLGFLISYFFTSYIIEFLVRPLDESGGVRLILTAPTEGFLIKIKVAFLAGIIISSPAIFYQLWKFIAPALYEKERKIIIPVVVWSVLLFLFGGVFAYWMLPYALIFFQSFAMDYAENFWSLGKYITIVTYMLLAFGVVFELPLVIYYITRMGLVTPRFLREKRRHAYIIILIIAAIVTPPDVITQIILSTPLIVLYEISIFLAVIAHRKRNRSDTSLNY
jgi:sec-independent protein translocase protein TatC